MNLEDMQDALDGIAIRGMVCRFPGANTVDAFWQNVRDGIESISFFSDAELRASGVDPTVFNHPNYVRAKGVLSDIELFDAAFFGYSPREAELLDPQQRLFMECAWEILEQAGYAPDAYAGRIGVYAGAGTNTYFLTHLYPNPELNRMMGGFQIAIGNENDAMPTRVSYKLNLTGPSVYVNTACSTSLVAVHMACQSLLTYQCEMAWAGGGDRPCTARKPGICIRKAW